MESPSKTFQVNDKNRFLLQQASLPTIPGNYSVEVNGTGCVYLQVSKPETQHHPSENQAGGPPYLIRLHSSCQSHRSLQVCDHLTLPISFRPPWDTTSICQKKLQDFLSPYSQPTYPAQATSHQSLTLSSLSGNFFLLTYPLAFTVW